jgi:hypothetical protein
MDIQVKHLRIIHLCKAVIFRKLRIAEKFRYT